MTGKPEAADDKNPQLKTYALRIERVRPDTFDSFDRAEKYESLRGGADQTRRQIIDWIEAEGLGEEIVDLGDPTAFSLIFAKSTPAGAERLRDAPGVLSVIEDPDIPLDLARVRESPRDPL